jgi:hypothetical protein
LGKSFPVVALEPDGLVLALQINRCNYEGLPSFAPKNGTRRQAPEPKFDCPSYNCSTQKHQPDCVFLFIAAEVSSATHDNIQELTSLASKEILT